jgi:phospholipid/cholesterol/gamma-HCH transport system ATP-binding protein
MAIREEIKMIDKLRFEGLSFSHESQDPTLLNADFEFPTDRVIWLKSLEGAGKSTLLQILAGLIMPQSGRYLINDDNVLDMSFEEFLPYRLSIGYTFDYGGLINNRTIEDNLLLPLYYHELVERDEAKKRVNDFIKLFDLGKFRNERPAHVPGRVRKIACLLRALVIQPQMLLMDDPSVGLGADTSQVFAEVINQQKDSGSLKHVFLSTYDNKFMEHFDYDVVHIDGGLLYYHEEMGAKKVVNL